MEHVENDKVIACVENGRKTVAGPEIPSLSVDTDGEEAPATDCWGDLMNRMLVICLVNRKKQLELDSGHVRSCWSAIQANM